jgi:cell division protein FtsZ
VHLQLKIKDEKAEADAEKKELEKKKQQLDERFEKLRQSILANDSSSTQTPKQNTTPPPAASGGYLARPSNIYAEHKPEVSTSKSAEEPVPAPAAKVEDQETFDMQLVIRNDIPAADMPQNHQTQTPQTPQAEESPLGNDAAEKQRTAERLQKLRNLSFNLNAADPNNEFETVPAYIRRNMELYNTSSSVENFYSNYTIKDDGKTGAHISTINTFLDGKKPD